MKKPITQEMIEQGLVELQVAGMIQDPEDEDSFTLADGVEPEFYDVLLRPTDETYWSDGSTCPIEEYCDLTLEEATAKANEIEARYPGIATEWLA